MSYSHLFLKSGFPRAPLSNGIGRYVCQLQRITLKFCKNRGSSRGMREFIERDLIDFARSYPEVVVYVKPRRHREPYMNAEFLSGETKKIFCKNFTRDEVLKWIHLYRTQSGLPELRLRKLWHTENPSIQGPWTPFTNRDPVLNATSFPDQRLSSPQNLPPSATEELLAMFKNNKLSES